jgi:hypothetical protein
MYEIAAQIKNSIVKNVLGNSPFYCFLSKNGFLLLQLNGIP